MTDRSLTGDNLQMSYQKMSHRFLIEDISSEYWCYLAQFKTPNSKNKRKTPCKNFLYFSKNTFFPQFRMIADQALLQKILHIAVWLK